MRGGGLKGRFSSRDWGLTSSRGQDPTARWGWGSGTRTERGLTREQPEGSPGDEEEGQHVGERGPAWPRTASPARRPAAPAVAAPPPPPPGIFSPRPPAPQRPPSQRRCGVLAGGGGRGARSLREPPCQLHSLRSPGRPQRCEQSRNRRGPGGGGAGRSADQLSAPPPPTSGPGVLGKRVREGRTGDERGSVTPSPPHCCATLTPRDPAFDGWAGSGGRGVAVTCSRRCLWAGSR